MPKEKSEKASLPPIRWKSNNWALAFSLLTELEKPENYKVFLGKRTSQENTSGETKIKVAQRMGQQILPELFLLNPKVLGERVRSELETLIATYSTHVKRLRKTGAGVQDTNAGEPEAVGGEMASPPEEAGELLIDGSGPNQGTPEFARNIWEEITLKFPLFPRMHALYASRPNVVPVAVTTGAGPRACKTRWIQAPSATAIEESRIDPFILEISQSQARSPSPLPPTPTPVSRQRSFGSDLMNQSVQSTPTQPSATAKLKAGLRMPHRASALDAVLDLVRQNTERLKEEQQRKQIDAERHILLEEFKAGIWTQEEYKEKVNQLLNPIARPPPSRLSPDWDEDCFENEAK